MLDFLNFNKRNTEETLKDLYAKNPHNSWYAILLAYYYYNKAEGEWRKGKQQNEWYRKTAKICLEAIQRLEDQNLRILTTLLLTCLETEGKWDELVFRTEQAFMNDSTFADALALRVIALLNQKDHKKEVVENEAKKVITLFKDAEQHEALFNAFYSLAILSSREEKVDNAITFLLQATDNAEKGEIDWALDEIMTNLRKKKYLEEIKEKETFSQCIKRLEKLKKINNNKSKK